jgi:hypothetical protein
MKLHIIHLIHRIDRLEQLTNQLQMQKITDFQIWPGLIDLNRASRGIAKAHQQIVGWAKDWS